MSSPIRRLTLWLLAAAVSLLTADLTARVALAIVAHARGLDYRPIEITMTPDEARRVRQFAHGHAFMMPNSDLGWTLRPGATLTGYHASPQGLRGSRLYDSVPEGSALRVAAFGDSFVFGDEVGDVATWPAQLESPGLEVMNFGVSGYGLDQAYLRYLYEGRAFRPGVVVIGIYADDVNRGLSIWRPFMVGEYDIPSAKPRFRLADSLILYPNPLGSAAAYDTLLAAPESVLSVLGSDDYFFHTRERAGTWDALAVIRLAKLTLRVRREQRDGTMHRGTLRADDAGPQLAIAVLRRFVGDVRADGAVPIIVCFPDHFLFDRYRQSGVRADAVLPAALPDVPRIDLYPLLAPHDFAPFGHYTPDGNRKVALAIRSYLETTGILRQRNSDERHQRDGAN